MTRMLLLGDADSVHLERNVRYLLSRGHDVHVASFASATIKGATMHFLPRAGEGKIGYLKGVMALRRLARTIRPEVVNAHYITSYGLVAALAGLKPLVLTAWGSDLLLNLRRGWLFKTITRFTFARSRALILVAAHMRDIIEDILPPKLIVENIPFGVKTDLFSYNPRQVISGDSEIRIVSTRNLADIYRIDTILEATAQAVAEGLPARLDVIGAGDLAETLADSAPARALGERVRFLGRIAHNELPAHLHRADIFITASTSDGNNVSLNEAMAAGTFPIVSDIVANRQWIEHGNNGLAFPVGDAEALKNALQMAAAEPEFRSSAIAENRRIAETQANWDVNAVTMERLLERVAKEGR